MNAPAAESSPKKPDDFARNTLARFATAMVGIPILLWALFWAPPWVFPVLCVVTIARAAHELFRMLFAEKLLYGWGLVATVLLATSNTWVFAQLGPSASHDALGLAMLVPLTIVGVSVLLPLAHPEPHDTAGLRVAWLVAGPLYVGGLLSTVPGLFVVTGRGSWPVLAMTIAWSSDTGAYFAGRFFGKHKLAPRVSPKKTVEGALGGLAGSIVGAIVMATVFMDDLPLPHAIGLAVVGNALGQLGDLAESLIKRSTGTKDSGSILPGHGGLLDRIDALMFTALVCLAYVLAR